MKALWKSVRLGIIILIVFIVYAYGFDVTQVNLNELRSERRQQNRVRVLRALARPDIFVYEREEFIVFAPVFVPCPPGGYEAQELDSDGPYLLVTPPCSPPGTEVRVEGFNFEPNTEGPVSFIPSTDPDYELALRPLRVQVDSQGHFETTYELPQRPSEEVQYIRTTTRRNVGTPSFSQNAILTFDRIIETIFLALLATTVGTLLAVPLSFIAARNIMRAVKSRLTSIALSLLGWPIGIAGGYLITEFLRSASEMLTDSLTLTLLGLLVTPIGVVGMARWALPQVEKRPPDGVLRVARIIALLVASMLGVIVFFLFSSILITMGRAIAPELGRLDFLGQFLAQVGDILRLLTPGIVALASGAVVGNLGGQLGEALSERLPAATVKILNLIFAVLSGAMVLALFGQLVNWLYQVNDPVRTFWIPATIGGAIGLVIALRAKAKEPLPIGIAIYYITRTILNAVRSIEALVMAIVAVIWVGIGPFAGTLALGLHTIVALAKLYSEQVESILPGPVEAITATGANRLQTIVYAVVPQVVPPYISFTMYRWDINVRMSTIIGFVGGGGIGLLLQQNVNLLNYRAASTQMIAIAIVVAAMDYVSSYLRERLV